MNKDLNPITEYTTHSIYHILVAFQFSEDAYSYDFKREFKANGDKFNAGCGEGIVLVNELKDSDVTVRSAASTWSFFSPNDMRTSSYSGSIEVSDRSGFFFAQSIKEFTSDLKISLMHATFMWVQIFVGRKGNSGVFDTIIPNPMFFHVTSFTQDITAISGRLYAFEFVSCYNSHGISPQFSQLNQITVNHKDSNTLNSIPLPSAPSSGIKSTRDEDSNKLSIRAMRLQKNKYMKTVNDVAKSLEYALNGQKNNHKKQLQSFMSIVKDNYVDKLAGIDNTDQIPVDYNIDISEYYKNKKIDNVNMPFEQTEVDQTNFGLSSITFPLQYNIHSALNSTMKMSKSIGNDHSKIPTRTYKFTTTSKTKCDGKYLINVKVNDYISPYNGEPDANSVDTGPGDGVVNLPIELTYQDLNGILSSDNTVSSITYSSLPNFSVSTIEAINNAPDTQDILGDREIITVKRKNDYATFYENSTSGMKSTRGIMTDNGLQDSESANAITSFNMTQQTLYTVNMIGNPHLLSDINRNPQSVIDNDENNAIIYKNVEFEPMYLRLKVFLAGDRLVSNKGTFYYDGMLHIYKITNIFSPGYFAQFLFCARTSEKQ